MIGTTTRLRMAVPGRMELTAMLNRDGSSMATDVDMEELSAVGLPLGSSFARSTMGETTGYVAEEERSSPTHSNPKGIRRLGTAETGKVRKNQIAKFAN